MESSMTFLFSIFGLHDFKGPEKNDVKTKLSNFARLSTSCFERGAFGRMLK